MAKANRQSNATVQGSSSVLAAAVAGLLILVGVVFQLGQLGYSHISASNFWLAAMITEGMWNFLAAHAGVPGLSQLERYWPLVFVTFGLGLLLLTKRSNGRNLKATSANNPGGPNGK